jgi:ATP-dependent Lon protease
MTGEITLRGKVLPVGGIKDKALAAYRAGITVMILPQENEKDLDDLPEEIRGVMEVHLVESMDEVLRLAIDHEFAPLVKSGERLEKAPSEPPVGPGSLN